MHFSSKCASQLSAFLRRIFNHSLKISDFSFEEFRQGEDEVIFNT